MANLTAEQVQKLIQNRPMGTKSDDVLQGLKRRGHSFPAVFEESEGIPFNPQQEIISPTIPTEASGVQDLIEGGVQKPKGTFLDKLSGGLDVVFGGRKIGEAIGTSLAKLGLTGLSPEERKAVSTGPGFGEIAGDIGKIGLTLGTLGGAGTAGGLLARAGKTAILGGGFGLSEALRDEKDLQETVRQTVRSAAVGAAIPVAAKGLSLGGRYLADRGKKLLGLFSGETEVVNAALRNPKIADIGAAQGDRAIREAVQFGSKRSIKMQESLLQAHKQSFDKIAGKFGSKTLSSRGEVRSMFNQLLRNNGVIIKKGGALDFVKSKIVANPGEISKIQAANKALTKWGNFKLTGVNEFKQLVGKLTRFADESGIPSKSPTLGTFYHQLDNHIKTKLPENLAKQYGKINARFSGQIDLYDDLVEAFNKGDPFTRVSQVFGKNKDSLRMLLDFYREQTGVDIEALVAGRELAAERSAAFGFLNPREWMDLLVSPKFQAKVVTTAGRGSQFLKSLSQTKLGEQTGKATRTGGRLFSLLGGSQ